jgi:hypothetical protein
MDLRIFFIAVHTKFLHHHRFKHNLHNTLARVASESDHGRRLSLASLLPASLLDEPTNLCVRQVEASTPPMLNERVVLGLTRHVVSTVWRHSQHPAIVHRDGAGEATSVPTGERRMMQGTRDLLCGMHRAVLVEHEDATLAWLVGPQSLVRCLNAPVGHATPGLRRGLCQL